MTETDAQRKPFPNLDAIPGIRGLGGLLPLLGDSAPHLARPEDRPVLIGDGEAPGGAVMEMTAIRDLILRALLD